MSLIRAFCDSDVDFVRRLLMSPSEKLLINDLDETGLAPVHYAAQAGHVDIVRELQEAGANLELEGREASPLHLAAASGSLPVIDFLLNHGAGIDNKSLYPDPFGSDEHVTITPLFVAASAGQFGAALHLLNRGADPRHRDQLLTNLLHYCVLGDLHNDPAIASDDLLAVMRAAVDAGVHPNSKAVARLDLEGYSYHVDILRPLDLAAIFNKAQLINFLVGAGPA